MSILQLNYFQTQDVVSLAKNLLGKLLFTHINGQLCGGIISETEAYKGVLDRACHAFGGRRTPRNEMMYARGGVIYVFRCYGVHNMLNVVTNSAEIPDAILIRGIFPTVNQAVILKRLNKEVMNDKLTSGPGKVTKALGIEHHHNGLPLDGSLIWIEDNPDFNASQYQILTTPRIGVDYAKEDALLPYRFLLKRNELKI